jgi:hypothetical protein
MSSLQQRSGRAGLPSLRSDVLKISHHGSARGCNTPEWLTAVNPEFAVISSDRSGNAERGRNSGYKVPQTLTLDRILQYCPNLDRNAPVRMCYGYFQESEYVDPTLQRNAWPPLGGPGDSDAYYWSKVDTNWGIYSTLGALGTTDAAADVGIQIECEIASNGDLEFATTDPEESNTP